MCAMEVYEKESFAIKDVAKYLFGFLALCFSIKYTMGGAVAILLMMAIGASLSRRSSAGTVFFILLSTVVMNITCDFFLTKNVVYFIGIRVVYMFFAVMMLMSFANGRMPQEMRFMIPLFVYLFYEGIVSMQGWAPITSWLKILLFSMFICAAMVAAMRNIESLAGVGKMRAAAMAIALFVITGSVALYPFPSISRSFAANSLMGYGMSAQEALAMAIQEQSLYSGVTNQSQTMGPLAAMFNAFILSDWAFNSKGKGWVYWVVIICAPVLIYWTQSRTAMAAYLFSLVVVWWRAQSSGQVERRKKGALLAMGGAAVVLIALALAFSQGLRDRVAQFALKYSQDASAEDISAENVFSTRIGKMEEGWYYFKQSPIFGNGFQVHEMMALNKGRKFDIRQYLTAPIEKSFWPTMVLDEGGIIGMAIFLAFLGAAFSSAFRHKSECFLACFSTMMVLNCGEATIFSVSACGGVQWALCFIALVFDVERNRRLNAARFFIQQQT